MSQSSASIVLPTKTKTSIPDSHCITNGQWRKSSQLWTIKGFEEYHCRVNKSLSSSEFSNSKNPEYKWYLTIVTDNLKFEGVDHIGLFLNLDRDNIYGYDILVNMTMYVRDAEGCERLVRQTQAIFTLDSNQHGCPNFVSTLVLFNPDPKNKFLPEDTLTVFCEFTYAELGVIDNWPRRGPKAKMTISNNLPKGLERLLHNQTFVDVTFVVGGKNFGVHRSILAARSPVFEAMFKHDLQENRLNKVNISDIRSEVFEEFLLFMYTDKTPNREIVTELFVVADKYQVEGLQELCEEIILEELSAENAINLLFFADLHGAERDC
ncbi:speckle-type POZ protein-like B [Planococcus citri]|uniref:speckle-type POZ protein-like B n=1 Tax=Planococcus citri TaxID=170843 RepID=UPI0031F9C3C1